jgi:hypothetical protein
VGGAGALFKVAIAAKSSRLTYLEACIRAYLGGNAEPLFLSSGLEDYFLGTYYFDTGRFYADMAGLTHFDKKDQKSFSAYRFHDQDPVFFQNGLRLTNRCGETEHGETEGPKRLPESPTHHLHDLHLGLSMVTGKAQHRKVRSPESTAAASSSCHVI